MVDALRPAADALSAGLSASGSVTNALDAMVEAAQNGAEATAAMTPRRGRSSYVGDRAIGFADPGAHAVALWLAALRNVLK